MLAIEALMPVRPDFVLSGVNHGHNMGEDVMYSGTVAAATEGVMLGIPAMAISFAGGDVQADPDLLGDQVDVLANLLKHLTGLSQIPRDTLLNINMPPLKGKEIKGVRLTRLGRRVYSDSLMRMKDPRGRDIYWIGGGSASWSGAEDSDFRAVRDGYISVTPLTLDLTHLKMLDDPSTWWRAP
jgi:5'-nucleotidase